MKALFSASALALIAAAGAAVLPAGEANAGGRKHHRSSCDSGLVYRGDFSKSHYGHGRHSWGSKTRVSVGLSFGSGWSHGGWGGRSCDDSWSVGGAYYFAHPRRTYSHYDFCDVPRVRTYTRAGVIVAPGAPVVVTQPAPTVVVIDGGRSGAGSQPSGAVEVKRDYAPSASDMQRGFALLSDGQIDRAQRLFGAYASISEEALPKVGYALAGALQGDVSTAAWGMRRAFFFDAGGVMYAPVDSGLRIRLEQLSQRLEDRASVSGADRDTLFVLASVDFLLGDRRRALFNVERAIAFGDDSESAQMLRALVASTAPAPGAGGSMYGPSAAPSPAEPQNQTQPRQPRIDPSPAAAPSAPGPAAGAPAATMSLAAPRATAVSNGQSQPSAR